MTLTKRNLVVRISNDTGIIQHEVMQVVQKTLDYIAEALAKGEPSRSPPKASQYSISEKDYEWMDSKLTAQPNSITDNPIKLTGALQKVPKKTFIRVPKYPQAAFDRAYAECKADPSWTTYLVESSHHDVMIDQPGWLADILMKHS